MPPRAKPQSNETTVEDTRQRDRDYLSFESEMALSTWLLSALSSEIFSPLMTINKNAGMSIPQQLYSLYSTCDNGTKEKFRRVIVAALHMWSPEMATRTLESLVNLVAYTQAIDALPRLRVLVDERDGLFTDPDEQYAVIDTVISVLRGIVSLPEVVLLFSRWFRSNVFDPRFAMQLFLGLCEAHPEKYYLYIDRFIWYINVYGRETYWQLDHILDELDEIVDTSLILSLLPEVPLSVRQEFINLLFFSQFSPYENVDVNLSMSRETDFFNYAFIQLSLKLVDVPLIEFPISQYPKPDQQSMFKAFKCKESVVVLLEAMSIRPVMQLSDKYLSNWNPQNLAWVVT